MYPKLSDQHIFGQIIFNNHSTKKEFLVNCVIQSKAVGHKLKMRLRAAVILETRIYICLTLLSKGFCYTTHKKVIKPNGIFPPFKNQFYYLYYMSHSWKMSRNYFHLPCCAQPIYTLIIIFVEHLTNQ